jgi:hypothetical protein
MKGAAEREFRADMEAMTKEEIIETVILMMCPPKEASQWSATDATPLLSKRTMTVMGMMSIMMMKCKNYAPDALTMWWLCVVVVRVTPTMLTNTLSLTQRMMST